MPIQHAFILRLSETLNEQAFDSLIDFLNDNLNIGNLLMSGHMILMSREDKWCIVSSNICPHDAFISLNNCAS
jgi:hypothetical protein